MKSKYVVNVAHVESNGWVEEIMCDCETLDEAIAYCKAAFDSFKIFDRFGNRLYDGTWNH